MNFLKVIIIFFSLLLINLHTFAREKTRMSDDTFMFGGPGVTKTMDPNTMYESRNGNVCVKVRVGFHEHVNQKATAQIEKLKTLPAEPEVKTKAIAVELEAEEIFDALQKCSNTNADIIDVLAINELVFEESSYLNGYLQKAKYDIQRTVYNKSGEYIGIQSYEDSVKIKNSIADLKGKYFAWKRNADRIKKDIQQEGSSRDESPYADWDHKIRTNSFNQLASRVLRLCKRGDFKQAQSIRDKYKVMLDKVQQKQKDPLALDHPDQRRFAELDYILAKYQLKEHMKTNPEAGRRILEYYEERYRGLWNQSDIVKRVHYANLTDIFYSQYKEFKVSSITTAARNNPVLAQKITNELEVMPEKLDANMKLLEPQKEEWSKNASNDRYKARLQSWQESVERREFTAKSHQLTREGEALYSKLGLDDRAFVRNYGDQFQHALHAELVTLANKAGLKYSQSKNQEARNLAKEIATYTDVGSSFLKDGLVLQAVHTADFCWALLDCGMAVGEGVVLGVQNVYHSARHPVETVQHLAEAVKTAGYCLYKLLDIVVNEHDLMFRDPQEYTKRWDYRWGRINTVLEAVGHKWKTTSTHDLIKETTAFVVEGLITDKLLAATVCTLSSASKKACEFAKKIEKAKKIEEVAVVTAEGIPLQLKIAEEATGKLFQKVGKVGLAESEICAISKFIAEVEYAMNIEPKVAHLKEVYDGTRKGFGEIANKTIKLDYKHMLAPEFNITKKGVLEFSGFHHDFGHALEKSGLINVTNKVMDKHGVYTADIWCYGKLTQGKTYFPSHWTHEEITRKVFEAYDNFIANGAKDVFEEFGKYTVIGKTSEGIKIKMHITKNGKMRAYPIIK